MIHIELMGAPRGKGRPRHGKGFTYTDPKTRSYEACLRYAAQEAMAGTLPLEGPLSLRVEAYLPIPTSWSKKRQLQASMTLIRPTTKPDFDNLLKSLDALNTVVWRDDAQVVVVSFAKFYSERPRLVVGVWHLADRIEAAA